MAGDSTIGAGEVHFSGNRSWEFPLCRSEKVQRLLQLFEAELHALETEASSLRKQNRERQQQCLAPSELEASVNLGLPGSSCILKGPPEQVIAVLHALASRGCKENDGVSKGISMASLAEKISVEGFSSASSSSSSACSSVPSSPSSLSPLSSGFPAASSKPTVPALALSRLGGLELSTPRMFSIRTPPSATPRAFLGGATATPRASARVWSLLTPGRGIGASRPSLPSRPLESHAEEPPAASERASGASQATAASQETTAASQESGVLQESGASQASLGGTCGSNTERQDSKNEEAPSEEVTRKLLEELLAAEKAWELRDQELKKQVSAISTPSRALEATDKALRAFSGKKASDLARGVADIKSKGSKALESVESALRRFATRRGK